MISIAKNNAKNPSVNLAFQAMTKVVDLGLIGLNKADLLMKQLTQQRLADMIPDTILLLTHPASLSVGARKLNPSDLLQPLSYFERQGILFHQHVRGGGLTYHWPGQLVCYPILKLQPHEQNIANYMFKLEEVGLRTLKDVGIVATRKRDKAAQIGLWLGNGKIASMGIHVSKWVTSWGFALNLYGDKSPANFIRPCGLEGVSLITIEEVLGQAPSRQWMMNRLIHHFEEVFQRRTETPKDDLENENRFQINFDSKIETTNFAH